MLIESPNGDGFVSTSQLTKGGKVRLDVEAKSDEVIFFASRDESEAFSWVAQDAAAAAGEYVIYVKNTSTQGKILVIREIVVGSAELAIWKLSTVTGTAAGGSEITGVCLNRKTPTSAPATARSGSTGGVTGLTEQEVVAICRSTADANKVLDMHDALILGQDQAIAVEIDTTAGAEASVVVIGHFEDN